VYLAIWMTKLRKQITHFPHGQMVDLLDALAYAISKARRPVIHDPDQGSQDKEPPRGRRYEPRAYTEVDYGGY
jgi:hypothetical protein